MNTLFRLLMAVAVTTVVGCGSGNQTPSANRSPLATDDPSRYEAARAQDEALRAKNAEAERRAMRKHNIEE